MADIKLDSVLGGTNSISTKIANELSEIKKAIQDSNRQTALEKSEPYQTKDSPYFPDRNFSNPLAVQGTAQESSWKEVPTYEERHGTWANQKENAPSAEMIVVLNNKKLNII